MKLVSHSLKKPVDQVTLCPLGDIQWAGDRSDLAFDHLQQHIKRCLSMPNPLFIGMGDYIDFASPSNRDALRSARLYDTARKVIADATKLLTEDIFEKVLKPTKGHWLGLLNGHHHFPIKGGKDSDAYLAELLGTEFLEEFGIIGLQFGDQRRVTVGAFHGNGNSVFPWGPLNRLYRLSPSIDVDVLLMGHQTKKVVGEYDHISPDFDAPHGSRLTHKTRHLVGTGGWTKGYIEGRSTYVSNDALNPVALGQPIVHIRPRFRVNSANQEIWDAEISVEV